MIVTTTPYIEGRHILEYKGIAMGSSEVFTGGFLSSPNSKSIRDSYKLAVKDMEEDAINLGANAVIGVQIVFDTYNLTNCNLINVSGTAVLIE